MRFLHLLVDLVGLPVSLVLLIIAVLGNLSLIVSLLPQSEALESALAGSVWATQITGWLYAAWLPNWVFVFALVLLIAVFGRAYRRLSAYYWPLPPISLTPKVEMRSVADRQVYDASLIAQNNQKQAITECTAILESAVNLGSSEQTPVTRIRNSRLRWSPEQASNDECRTTLPPGADGAAISVADTASGFQFAACKPSGAGSGLLGIYVVKIRVEGNVKGQPIQPVHFDGYLYVSGGRADQALTILFEEGDWTQDRRLPRQKYVRIGNWRIKRP